MHWSRAFHGVVASRQTLDAFRAVVDVSDSNEFTRVKNNFIHRFVQFRCSHIT